MAHVSFIMGRFSMMTMKKKLSKNFMSTSKLRKSKSIESFGLIKEFCCSCREMDINSKKLIRQ